MKTVKCVDYSYPTSTNASRFKLPKGCYTVNLTTIGPKCTTHAMAAFPTKDEAIAYAESMPNEWASWAKK